METEAIRAGASISKTARALFEYGAEKEGYWNSNRFMANIKDAVATAEFKYPQRRIRWYLSLIRAAATMHTLRMI